MPNWRPPAVGGIDMEQPIQLDQLHTAGVLSDDAFTAAKAKLPGILEPPAERSPHSAHRSADHGARATIDMRETFR